MGTILKGKCPACGLEAEVKVGGGLWDWKPETIQNAAPAGPDLDAAMASGSPLSIERCLSVCKTCKKIVTGTYVCYQLSDADQVQRLTKGCPLCGGPLHRCPPNAQVVGCPNCAHIIEMHPAGQWD